MQPDIMLYATMALYTKRVIFDMNFETSATNRPSNVFQFLSGAAFGPDALVTLLRYYGWKQVGLLFLSKSDTAASARTFTVAAEKAGIHFALSRQSSNLEADQKALVNAASNVFIFFGGSNPLKCRTTL